MPKTTTVAPSPDDDGPPTSDEIALYKAARRLGITAAAAVVRLLSEPGDQCDLDAETTVTMEQAQAQLDWFLRLDATLVGAKDDDERCALAEQFARNN